LALHADSSAVRNGEECLLSLECAILKLRGAGAFIVKERKDEQSRLCKG
jgi:hypothetical protein